LSDIKYAYPLILNKVTYYARNLFRLRVAALICALVAGCSMSPAGVPIESLNARPQGIPAQQVHADARGPIIRFARGAAEGVPFEMSAYDTASGRCVALVLAGAGSAGCIPLGELPDDDVLTRLAGGGTSQSVNPEAGLAAPAVEAVWVELRDGRRVDGHVVDLRPAIDTSVYFFFLAPNADAQSLVAADDDGAVLTRIELEGE
jgi:hypothetical protein